MGEDPAAPSAACAENNFPYSWWPGSHPESWVGSLRCAGDAGTRQLLAMGLLPGFAALASPGLAYRGFAGKLLETTLKHRRQP